MHLTVYLSYNEEARIHARIYVRVFLILNGMYFLIHTFKLSFREWHLQLYTGKLGLSLYCTLQNNELLDISIHHQSVTAPIHRFCS